MRALQERKKSLEAYPNEVRVSGGSVQVPEKHRPRRPRENSSFPAVADALSLCLQAKAHQALCGAETDLGEREGSWETEHLRGHMGLRLGPKYWPGGAQVFWFQG